MPMACLNIIVLCCSVAVRHTELNQGRPNEVDIRLWRLLPRFLVNCCT